MEDGGAEAPHETETHPACTSPERKHKCHIRSKHETEHLNSKLYGFSKTNREKLMMHKVYWIHYHLIHSTGIRSK